MGFSNLVAPQSYFKQKPQMELHPYANNQEFINYKEKKQQQPEVLTSRSQSVPRKPNTNDLTEDNHHLYTKLKLNILTQ